MALLSIWEADRKGVEISVPGLAHELKREEEPQEVLDVLYSLAQAGFIDVPFDFLSLRISKLGKAYMESEGRSS